MFPGYEGDLQIRFFRSFLRISCLFELQATQKLLDRETKAEGLRFSTARENMFVQAVVDFQQVVLGIASSRLAGLSSSNFQPRRVDRRN